MTPEQLTTARVSVNLSKFALAKLAGVSRSRVGDFEAGRKRITDGMAARLREALARATEETGR